MRRIIVGPLVLCLGWFLASSAYAQPPLTTTPGYQHDRFVTLPRDHVKEFPAYLASFDTNDDDDGDGTPECRGVPEFVAYQLKQGKPFGPASKPGKWLSLPGLPVDTPSPTDDSYKDSGYSRGHMCMRDHAHRLGSAANYYTFSLINACPQKQSFNAGHWLGLEYLCAKWADAYGSVWIVCGPVFKDKKASKWIGDAGEVPVAVPDGFFKPVVKDSTDPKRPHVLAFCYEHLTSLDDSSEDVDHSEFLKSVDWIEQRTGLNFLSDLNDDIEDELEREPAAEIWPTVMIAKAPGKKLTAVAGGPSKAKPDKGQPAEKAAPALPAYVNGKVTFIPDGDTVHLQQGKELIKVRLHAIDCPESDQTYGNTARDFTSKFVTGKDVTIKVYEKDRYGRLVGEVFVDGHSLNRELARNGLAWWYERYASGDHDMQRLVMRARADRIGLWSEDSPIPPWDWRAGK